MRFGSAPTTLRFAAYHRGHSRATCCLVARGPRCRAAIAQRLAPRTTVTLRAPDAGDGVCGAGPGGPRAGGVRGFSAGAVVGVGVTTAAGVGVDDWVGVDDGVGAVRMTAPNPGSGAVATG